MDRQIEMAFVLVVDDETLVRMCAADMAEELGYQVIEAGTADAAIEILESRSDIRLVFSDVQMPGTMDGLQLVNDIRDRWPPVGLVLTSGNALARDAHLPDGAFFIPKPYNTQHIANAFEKALAAV
jgi:CheY-like chemotaxis protein